MRRRQIPVLAVSVILAGLAGYGLSGTALAQGGGGTDLRARMSGDQEVPPADPDGEGRGRFQFTIGDDELCFRVRFDDIGTPNRGHIHLGGAGVNGGIEVTLFDLTLPATAADERHDALEQGELSGCVPADPADLEAIAANPGGYYCNLHNARFPGGAIRGQLE
jgi:hypothetical protein